MLPGRILDGTNYLRGATGFKFEIIQCENARPECDDFRSSLFVLFSPIDFATLADRFAPGSPISRRGAPIPPEAILISQARLSGHR